MTLWSATSSIGTRFLRSFTERAADQAHQPFRSRAAYYELQEAYYNNSLFETIDARFAQYRAYYQLPRRIRPIYNPTRRAVDFYPGHVYPGGWSEDGMPLPNGKPNAFPFAPDTDPALRIAAMQIFTWGNWRSERYAYVRTGAKLGDAFIEMVDDLERRKVYPKLIWPGYVVDLDWNDSGDVVAYAIEYRAEEANGRPYVYRREVDKEAFRTFKDGQPFAYDGVDAVTDNPYGFCPGIWVQHRNVGGQHGAPVIDGVHGKIDTLNASAAAIHGYIGKFVEQGAVFFTDKDPSPVFDAMPKAGATDALSYPPAGSEQIRWWRLPKDSTIGRLIENLGLAEAEPYMDSLIEEIEADLPETVMDEQLRSMDFVTGPGGERLMSDIASKNDEAQGNYDSGIVKAGQMGVAIAGWRLATGAWGRGGDISRQQAKFAPFDLLSYDAGQLDFALMPRPLIPETEGERLDNAVKKKTIGISDEQIWRELGYDEAMIAAMSTARDARRIEVAAQFGGGG